MESHSSSLSRPAGPSHPYFAPTSVPRGPIQQIIDAFDNVPPAVPIVENGFAHLPFGNVGIIRTDVARAARRHQLRQLTPKPDATPLRMGGSILAARLIKKSSLFILR